MASTQAPNNRDIVMTQEDGTKVVKFFAVPYEFTHQEVKHADLAGMYYTFRDGKSWPVLQEKRLFRMQDDQDERADEDAADYPLMSHQELTQVLQHERPYEELLAHFEVAMEARRAVLKRDGLSCGRAG